MGNFQDGSFHENVLREFVLAIESHIACTGAPMDSLPLGQVIQLLFMNQR